MEFRKNNMSAQDVEINQLTNNKNREYKGKKMVEIFTALTQGKDVSKYGKDVDKCIDTIKQLGKVATNGNYIQQVQAMAEINSIRTLSIETPLQERLSITNVLGDETTVGYDEELRVQVEQLQGEMSREQASSGSFTFPVSRKKTITLNQKLITGGMAVDLREVASGNINAMGYANEQVVTDMTNKYVAAQDKALRDGIKNSTGIKVYFQGYTKDNLDKAIEILKRWGKTTISGDYSAISEIKNFAGFDVTPLASGQRTQWIYSQSVMDEIMKTGLLHNYLGSPVVEIPNSYNPTKLNTDGTYYDTYLNETGLFIIPQGTYNPLKICRRGGLTTSTAYDINTRQTLTRYDIEYSNIIIPELIPCVGLIDKQ